MKLTNYYFRIFNYNMIISNINLISYTGFKTNNYKKNNNISADTFVRTTSFGNTSKNQSFEEFKKWAEETNFIDNVEEIVDSTGEYLGSGFEGTTYGIPGTDKWVVKEDKRSAISFYKTEKPQIVEIKDKAPSLNIGQMIAYIKKPISKNATRTLYILKRQKGHSFGVPYDISTTVSKENIDMHISSLKKMSSLPLEAYSDMIDDVITANNAGFKFDYYNPNNILIDEDNKKIGFVDVTEEDIYPLKNQLPDILYCMLDGEFAINFNRSANSIGRKFEAQRYSNEIFSKFIMALEKKGIKLDKSLNLQILLSTL